MYFIQIGILGPVSFERNMNSEVECRYDVPVDSFDIPYIPPRALLDATGDLLSGAQIGFAHPDGYIGRVMSAQILKDNIPGCGPYIKDCFLTGQDNSRKDYSVRALKPGQVFKAFLNCREEETERIEQALKEVHQLGVVSPEDGITGEVEIRLVETERQMFGKAALRDKCSYTSLDLDLMTISPTCFYTPFSEKGGTELFVPGSVILDSLMKWMGRENGIDWDQMICSNAYLCVRNTRLLPTPICVSIIKLDREQLRYRLAPGKNPRITEQGLNMQGTFGMDFQKHLTRYTVPETKFFISESGERYEALTEGMAFRGTIYGPDAALRQIADFVSRFPIMQIGSLTNEGFGEVYARVPALHEGAIPEEHLPTCFDICCRSDTLILNDRGVPTCRAEDLLAEIEYVLGVSGRLRVAGKYTAFQKDYTRNSRWEQERTVVRCFAKGSILRLETVGGPLDISRIIHCFIGERNREGYGEMAAWPAQGTYYRLAEKITPERYEMPGPIAYRDIVFGSRMNGEVINEMIRNRLTRMGKQDREVREAGIRTETDAPMELLRLIRELDNPLLEEEQLVRWYHEGLTGGLKHESE